MQTGDVGSGVPRTKLCDVLGVRHPLVQAPMAGGWTTPEMVAAVSEAGGIGTLAGAMVPPEGLREDIRAVKALTDKPFGVNFQLAPPEPGNENTESVQAFLDGFREDLGLPPGERELAAPPLRLAEQLAAVFEEGVPVLSLALGDPGELVAEAHEAGVPVVVVAATTVEEAVLAGERGADVVVAQGAEAGGHRSIFAHDPRVEAPLVGTFALVPQVVDAVGVPVVAAGGIADGRGLVAALALGASGAQVGTRFLVAKESGAFPAYKERLLSATEADTVVTRSLTGRPARALRNRLLEKYLESGPEPLAWPLQRAAAADIYAASRDTGDHALMLAGQGLRLLKKEQGAAEIVAEIVAEAGAEISRLRDPSG